MDGIPSIRVHNGIDYKGATRFIRWTEVFIIKVCICVTEKYFEYISVI